METQFLTAAQVRERFGKIHDVTLWRWLQNDALGFPRPVKIRKRRFFKLDEIEAFEARQIAA